MSSAQDGGNIQFQPGGILGSISEKIDVPEAALRLLLTIIAGYPVAAIFRCVIEKQNSKPLQHIYFALSGFFLCMFNYGIDTYHSLIAIWITYLLVRLLYKSPMQMVIINFVFHMAYLLIGYYCTASNNYDILWTMPHCVLVLRMIGFGFDVADGQKPREKLSKDQLETALEETPTLLELTAFAYFPCSFLVGPQFPFRRYQRFTNGEFKEFSGSCKAGMHRMLIGVAYLGVRQIGGMVLPDDYFLTDAYQNQPFVWRVVYLGLWGKLSLYKYISIWLLTEGALMCIGISYAGKTAEGADDWSGCCNVKLILLETGNTMGHYVQSFNVNTNQWLAQYVYKRLRFLNNRNISYGAALGFLALWHGLHSGYYMSFFIEYMIVTIEKQIENVYVTAIVPKYGPTLNNSLLFKCLEFVVLKSYNIIFIGWCLAPFIFLSYPRWIRVQASVNFFGFVYVAVWLVIYQIYKYYTRRSKTSAVNASIAPVAPMGGGNKKED